MQAVKHGDIVMQCIAARPGFFLVPRHLLNLAGLARLSAAHQNIARCILMRCGEDREVINPAMMPSV